MNLILGFCSITPEQYTLEFNNERIKEYTISINQLKRMKPDNFNLLLIDNTYYSVNNNGFIHINQNKGLNNRGLGELDMLKHIMINDWEEIIKNYEIICYVTARHFFTSPYFFNKVNDLEREALIGNPDFVYLNGEIAQTEKKGMYNDMAFAMKKNIMKQYADSINIDTKIGSEQLLYNFINKNKIDYEWYGWIGIIRNDWQRTGNIFDLRNYHAC